MLVVVLPLVHAKASSAVTEAKGLYQLDNKFAMMDELHHLQPTSNLPYPLTRERYLSLDVHEARQTGKASINAFANYTLFLPHRHALQLAAPRSRKNYAAGEVRSRLTTLSDFPEPRTYQPASPGLGDQEAHHITLFKTIIANQCAALLA
eukprot:1155518-Pelagomonas_calceolata.AAC.3